MSALPPLDPAPLHRARALLLEAIERKTFPGAVLAVGHQGRISLIPVGTLTYETGSPTVSETTIYDLASLTKPIFTATCAMLLVDSGRLDLDSPVSAHLPEFLDESLELTDSENIIRGKVAIRHLLSHNSGLPAYEKFFLRARKKEHVIQEACSIRIDSTHFNRTVYSDIGFILLGEILERISGKTLDILFQDWIAEPLGMGNTGFNPAPENWMQIAPTEQDNSFRNSLIQGEVHDENAWVMGGVAGHAGLFGTAGDLGIFCQMMLRKGQWKKQQLIQPQTIQELTVAYPASQGAPFALGWDKPSGNSSSGKYFSLHSIGHLGFTGTSIWIDPQKDLFVILLTNRVHPTRDNDAIKSLRPRIHDAVVEGLGLQV